MPAWVQTAKDAACRWNSRSRKAGGGWVPMLQRQPLRSSRRCSSSSSQESSRQQRQSRYFRFSWCMLPYTCCDFGKPSVQAEVHGQVAQLACTGETLGTHALVGHRTAHSSMAGVRCCR